MKGRTRSKTICKDCGIYMYDGYDKKLRQWFLECSECGRKRYPDLLRHIFSI